MVALQEDEGVELKIEGIGVHFENVALEDLWDLFMKDSIFYRWLGLRLEMNFQGIWRPSGDVKSLTITGGETVPRERMVVLQETTDEGMEEESLKCGGRISQV